MAKSEILKALENASDDFKLNLARATYEAIMRYLKVPGNKEKLDRMIEEQAKRKAIQQENATKEQCKNK